MRLRYGKPARSIKLNIYYCIREPIANHNRHFPSADIRVHTSVDPPELSNLVHKISRPSAFHNRRSIGGNININRVLVQYVITIIANRNPTFRGLIPVIPSTYDMRLQ